jgi:dephospho-CoA kinase
MSMVLCFAGQIGSGKSSVSEAVATALNWRRTGFGDYVRRELSRRGGDPNSRIELQTLGQTLVEADPRDFCRQVLSAGGFQPGGNIVVDGIRHVDIFEILKALAAPSEGRLLFLNAATANRIERVNARSDSADFERASEHHVEAELRDTLPERADAIIDADRPLGEVVSECIAMVQNWI